MDITYPPDLEEKELVSAWRFLLAISLSEAPEATRLVVAKDAELGIVFLATAEDLLSATVLGMVFPDGTFLAEPGAEISSGDHAEIRSRQGRADADLGLTARDLDQMAWATMQDMGMLPLSSPGETVHFSTGSPYLLDALVAERSGRIVESVEVVFEDLDRYHLVDLALWAAANLERISDSQLRSLLSTRHTWMRALWLRVALRLGKDTGPRLRAIS